VSKEKLQVAKESCPLIITFVLLCSQKVGDLFTKISSSPKCFACAGRYICHRAHGPGTSLVPYVVLQLILGLWLHLIVCMSCTCICISDLGWKRQLHTPNVISTMGVTKHTATKGQGGACSAALSQ
jgi:hypothetical protein